MSEFVAGAFVDVKPETKGFREDLKRKVNRSIDSAGVFKIPVELDPKRFKSTVANAARQSPAKIPLVVGTSVADLRKQILSKIESAKKGVSIKVPIIVEQAGRGAKGGTSKTGGSSGSSSSGSGGGTSQKTQTIKKLTDAERQQIAVDKALAKSQQELAKSALLSNSALDTTITAEERAVRVRQARQAADRAVKASNDQLAISGNKLTATQRQALEASLADSQARRSTLTDRQKEIALQEAQAATSSRSTKARGAAATAMRVEIKELTKLNALQAIDNKLSHEEARLKAQTAKARDLGLTSVVGSNEKTQREIAQRRELITLRREELKGETAAARSQKTAARGGFSTALSLLGVRGATLAANNAFLIGAASAALFAKSLASFASLEEELNVFQATVGATAEQMKEVALVAHDLGADISLPGVSAADAAQAMSELARAGLSVRDSMQGARGVLELAAAAQISNAEAATLTASALNAFGLEGEEAVRVADLLANAANFAQGSISEFGAAMQQALAISKLVGISLQDTIAHLAIFARNGLRGSDAGTSLRTALSRLIAPTKVASDLIQGLGLNLRDTQGRLRPDVFVQFGEATKDLSPALRDMIAQTIAGQDAIRAFAIGADEGRRGLQRAQIAMAATGTAAQLAGARAKGLGGSFRALGSNVETLGTQLGKFAAGPVAQTVTALTDFVGILNNLATGNFSGIFDQVEKDADQFVRNMERHGSGLRKVFTGQDLREGLKEIFTPAGPPDDRIKQLQAGLAQLNNLKLQVFDTGGDIRPITEQIKRIRSELKAAKVDAGLIIPVTDLEKQLAPLEEAKRTATNLKNEILRGGGGKADVRFLDDILRNIDVRMRLATRVAANRARELKRETAKAVSGTEIANSFTAQFKLIAQNVDLASPEVIAQFFDLARKIKGTAPLTGQAGAAVGQRLMKSLNDAINNAVEEDNPEVAASLKQLATKLAALFGGELGAAFKNIKVPLTAEALEEALLPKTIVEARAEAFGSTGAQVKAKQATLAALNKQLDQVVKGSAEEEAILNKISAKRGEIRSLREGVATDQKQADAESDKRVQDSLSGAEQQATNKLSIARESESLKDDIREQLRLRAFYTQQIATIRGSVRDADTRRDAIAAAEQNLFEVERDLAQDRRKRREQIRDEALKGIDDRAERAGETETLKDDVKQAQRRVNFWRREVAVVKQLVRDRKATGEELKQAREDLDKAEDELRVQKRARRDQRRETRQEGFELDIAFAETTENKGLEVKARRAFVAFLERQKKFFRGNVNKLKELRNEIAAQKKAIKEVNDEAKEEKGTTAFELLAEAAATFRANAGNLIDGNQPFAGPAGFTADMAQFLRRQQKGAVAATPLPSSKLPTSDSLSRNDQAHFGNLTASIDRLNDTIGRIPGVGKSKGRDPLDRLHGDRSRQRDHFAVATASRQVVERRSGV